MRPPSGRTPETRASSGSILSPSIAVTAWPSLIRWCASVKPAGPSPTTSTLRPLGGLGSGRSLLFIIVAAICIWLISGFYRVEPEEQGVAMIFGRWVATTQPGLNYNLPAPIGSAVQSERTTQRKSRNIASRTVDSTQTLVVAPTKMTVSACRTRRTASSSVS